MPLHKRIKILVEVEVPESREKLDPSQLLNAGAHVEILSMQKTEVTDVVIKSKINERQRVFNEYKRVLQAAVDKTPFHENIALSNHGGHKSISIMVPGFWGNRRTPAFSMICEGTTISYEEWVTPKKIQKFELGRPNVIDDLAVFIQQRLVEYKKQNRGVKW